MNAVIFDIDGTLVQSDDVDADLYMGAVQAVLGPVRLRESWERYLDVTDSAILEDICLDNKIVHTCDLRDEVRAKFVAALAHHIDSSGPFREIPGARDFVLSLCASDRYLVAYATGGWAASGKLKLSSAGFPLDIPLASSEDSPRRTGIMTHALAQMGSEFSSISYYGDGSWDRDAAKSLGWQFVAVGKILAGLNRYEAVGA
jgi:FMN phosphatase YigB (HAD superfamily)